MQRSAIRRAKEIRKRAYRKFRHAAASGNLRLLCLRMNRLAKLLHRQSQNKMLGDVSKAKYSVRDMTSGMDWGLLHPVAARALDWNPIGPPNPPRGPAVAIYGGARQANTRTYDLKEVIETYKRAAHGPLVNGYDLFTVGRVEQWIIRDQGSRETCVAHAATYALEAAYYPSFKTHLSEEFLQYAIKTPPTEWANSDQSCLREVAIYLKQHGICRRSLMPSPTPAPLHFATPSAQATRDARRRRTNGRWLPVNRTNAKGVAQRLYDFIVRYRVPVAVNLPEFTTRPSPGLKLGNWSAGQVFSTGNVLDFIPTTTESLDCANRHVVCILGFVRDQDVPGKGKFIFVNSLGNGWGGSVPAGVGNSVRGFGSVSAAYVEAYLSEMWCPSSPPSSRKKATLDTMGVIC